MKKVLVLGGGYGSLSFLRGLKFNANLMSNFSFTLISQEPSHYTSVLLHETVSNAHDVSVNFAEVLPPQVGFARDTVVEVGEGVVRCEGGEYEYDVLVLGLGFSSDDFKIPGVKEYAHAMQNYHNCLEINHKLKELISKKPNAQIIVCGGGFSGIELVGNLSEDWPGVKIHCVEAMGSILPMFDPALALHAKGLLEGRGVSFHLNSKILECTSEGLIIEREGAKNTLPADFILWTAGVKGNEVVAASPFFTSARSKVEVDEYLNPTGQAKEMKNIFILGDCAALKDPGTGRFHPPTAQLAFQQGEYLARVFNRRNFALELAARIAASQGEGLVGGGSMSAQPPQPFIYASRATICSLGNSYAIGFVGSTQIKGRLASWIKKLVEFKWLFKLKGLRAVL